MLRDACPGARCVLGLHLDETSVHVHGEMPALVRHSDGTYRVGNAAVREGLARLAPTFATENERIRQAAIAREAKAAARDADAVAAGRKPKPRRRFIDKGPDAMYLGAEAQMRLAHDAYAHRMTRFGIERGRGGGKAYAAAIDRGKGMRAKLEAMERDRLEAERARHDAVAIKAELEEGREQVITDTKFLKNWNEELQGRQQKVVSDTAFLTKWTKELHTGTLELAAEKVRHREEHDQQRSELDAWSRRLAEQRGRQATRETELDERVGRQLAAAQAAEARARVDREAAAENLEDARRKRGTADEALHQAQVERQAAAADAELAKGEREAAQAAQTGAQEERRIAVAEAERAKADLKAAAEAVEENRKKELALGQEKYDLQCLGDALHDREGRLADQQRVVAKEREAAVADLRMAMSERESAKLQAERAEYAWSQASEERAAADEERRAADEREEAVTAREGHVAELLASLEAWHKRSIAWVAKFKEQRRKLAEKEKYVSALAKFPDAGTMLEQAHHWLVRRGRPEVAQEMMEDLRVVSEDARAPTSPTIEAMPPPVPDARQAVAELSIGSRSSGKGR